jgi:hypothetical protein
MNPNVSITPYRLRPIQALVQRDLPLAPSAIRLEYRRNEAIMCEFVELIKACRILVDPRSKPCTASKPWGEVQQLSSQTCERK